MSVQTIRTVQVARHLGISPRDLREKIISKVNFGVKPTEREIPMTIASGIVRYASRVLKISCPPLEEVYGEGSEYDIEEEALDTPIVSEEIKATPKSEEVEKTKKILDTPVPEEKGNEDVVVVEKVVSAPKTIKAPKPPAPLKRANLTTLEKLRGIGNQSQGDVERKKVADKKREEEKIIEREKREKEEAERKKLLAQQKPKKSFVKKGPTIMRKIEISKEDAEAAKKKKEQREAERQRKKEEEEESMRERKIERKKRQEQIFTKKEGIIEIPSQLSVKEFSEKIGVPVPQVLSVLMNNGMMVTITQNIDFDTASIIAEELEVTLKKGQEDLSSEDMLKGDLSALLVDEPENLIDRPPVIAVVGHVDHGKTSILDAIRQTKVVDGESGGITQHIGAYSIERHGKNITFLDTPGHAAFTSMRSRGAKTADIVILVVAADDGVKPQTIEAISHARAAEAQIIIAANKIDKESANLDKLKSELSEHGVQTEDWGGDIPFVPVSALQGKGIEELLEMVFLQAEVMELKANPKRLAVGTVIESHLDPGLGPVATVLVNTGTMSVRDYFVLGSTWGRVKVMENEDGKKLKSVGPSGAARISGMNDLPEPGDIFQVLKDKKELKRKKEELENLKHSDKKTAMGMADIIHHINAGNMQTLNLVVKTDTIGSLEAIAQSLNSIGNSEVSIKIIHSAAGDVSESDILMASASNALVIAFHSKAPNPVRQLSEKKGVDIKDYEIIYKLIEDMTDILEGMLEPEVIETITGELKAKAVFYTKGKRKIVGGKVETGYFEHPCKLRIKRDGEVIGDAKLTGIQHFEDKVRRIESPQECGLNIEGFLDEILENDILEGVITETIIRKLSDVKDKKPLIKTEDDEDSENIASEDSTEE